MASLTANEQLAAYNKSVLKIEILAAPAPAVPIDIFSAGGFESPLYTTTAFGNGMLEGQPIGKSPVWQQTVDNDANPNNNSFAFIQTTAKNTGTQAVQFNRAAGAVDRLGVKFTNAPQTNTVTITWAMQRARSGAATRRPSSVRSSASKFTTIPAASSV